MSIEPSNSVFEALMGEAGTKFKNSLKRIKKACDLIVETRGQMNYSSVGRVATQHFGGPKKQTIKNNDKLKRYIAARIEEYRFGGKAHMPSMLNRSQAQVEKYPVSNLDPRTKACIDSLRDRLNLVETRYKIVAKQLEENTRANPVDFGKAIGIGPNNNGELQLEYKSSTDQLDSVREGIRTLLTLDQNLSSVCVESRGDKKRLTHKRPAGEQVLVGATLYAALEQFLKDTEYA